MRRFTPLLFLALACADPTVPDLPNGYWSANDTWSGRVIITTNTADPRWPADPFDIQGAEVKGDSLELTVSYGGGCREHTFLLLADAAWMESYPVQTAVRLSHEANDDLCKAYLTRVLRFDLSPLRSAYMNSYQTTSGIIRLRIAGATSSPTYAW